MAQADEHAALSTAPGDEGRKTWVAAGGILGALAASSCCILPLVLFSLGAGGAWIGNLTALAPYQPIFVAITLGFLGYGYWLVYRKSEAACADGAASQPHWSRRRLLFRTSPRFCSACRDSRQGEPSA